MQSKGGKATLQPLQDDFPFHISAPSVHLGVSFESKVITLTNKSDVSQRVTVLPFLTKHFRATRLDQTPGKGIIAPGMTFQVKVEVAAMRETEHFADVLRLRAASTRDSDKYVETEIEITGGDNRRPPLLTIVSGQENPSQLNTADEEKHIPRKKTNSIRDTRERNLTVQEERSRQVPRLTKHSNPGMRKDASSMKQTIQDRKMMMLEASLQKSLLLYDTESYHKPVFDPNASLQSQLHPDQFHAGDFKNVPRAFNFIPSWVGGTSEQRFTVKNAGDLAATFHWILDPNDKASKWRGDSSFKFVKFEKTSTFSFAEHMQDSFVQELGKPLSSMSLNHADTPDVLADRGFSLDAQETGIITFSFTPRRTGPILKKIYLSNDITADILEFTLIGEGVFPDVIREQIEDKALPILNTVFFSECYSSTISEKQIQYTNLSSAPVDYHWQLFTLYRSANGIESLIRQRLYELDAESMFEVVPSAGTIPPNQSQIFTIRFKAPTNLSGTTILDSYIALFLDDIPGPVPGNFTNIDDYPFLPHIQADPQTYFFNKLKGLTSSTDPHDTFKSTTEVFEEYLSTTRETKPTLEESSSFCVSFVKIHAVCKPPPIRLSNHHILFGLPIVIGSITEKTFDIINDSPLATSFYFGDDIESEYFTATFSPMSGSLPPHSRVQIKFSFMPKTLGEIATAFQCHFENNIHAPLVFRIRAIVKGPSLYVDSTMIDFGVSEVGKGISTTIRLTNASNSNLTFLFGSLASTYNSEADSQNTSLDEGHSERSFQYPPMVTFEPSSYQLLPYESILVSAHLHGHYSTYLNEIVPIYVQHGDTTFVSLRADIQNPRIVFGEGSGLVDFGTTYLDTPSKDVIVTMRNFSSLSTNFYWYCDVLNQDLDFQVTVTPESGTIPPNETIDVKIRTISRVLGDFEKVLPCFFQDSKDLYSGLILKSTVEGLSVQLAAVSEQEQTKWFTINMDTVKQQSSQEQAFIIPSNFSLDFGKVVIGEKPKVIQMKIKKLVDMFAFFRIAFQNYQAPVIHSRRQANVSFHADSATNSRANSRDTSCRSSIRVPAQKSQSKPHSSKQVLPFQSKDAIQRHEAMLKEESDEKFYEEALSNEYGCAFDGSLLNGPIEGVTSIDLMCYANVAGEYQDVLVVEIEPLPPIHIPVKATVVGCPVRILPKTLGLRPMKSLESYTNPTLVWPTLSPNDPAVSRKLLVKNILGVPISLRWCLIPGATPVKTALSFNEESGLIEVYCQENEIDLNDLEEEVPLPFQVSPRESTMKPGEVQEFELTYAPNFSGLGETSAWNGCYLKSLCSYTTQRKYPSHNETIHRSSQEKDSECLTPIRLQMIAECVQPELSISCSAVKYKCSIYEAQEVVAAQLRGGNPSLPRKEITITNTSGTPRTFTLSFTGEEGKRKGKGHFKIVGVIGGQHPLSRPSLTATTTPLSPRKTILKPVPLKESGTLRETSHKLAKKSLLGSVKQQRTGAEGGNGPGGLSGMRTPTANTPYYLGPGEEMRVIALVRMDQLSLTRHEYDKHDNSDFKSLVIYPGSFNINFPSGHCQAIPADVYLHFPTISTSTSSLNFETVGRYPTTKSFKIFNYSSVSNARWKIIEPKQEPRVFFIQKAEEDTLSQPHLLVSGEIEPHGHADVLVTFRPRASKKYDMNILIQTEEGRNIMFSMSGTGNLDEMEQGDEEATEQIRLSKRTYLDSTNLL